MLEIFVDGDACPVKEEVYRVAKRYSLDVWMVCNSEMRIPKASWIKPIVVGAGFDAVDDWIATHAGKHDIVITNDLLLAERCLALDASVLDPRGKLLTKDNIGELLATRELMTHLRHMGEMNLGPKGMAKKHRSNFLAQLDQTINAVKRSLG